MIDKHHILEIFRSTDALLEGHFLLTSGRHSASYFQCAKVLQHPEYLAAFSIIIADEFEPIEPDLVISPAIGGIVLGTEVGTQLGCRTIFAERKEGFSTLNPFLQELTYPAAGLSVSALVIGSLLTSAPPPESLEQFFNDD